MNTASRIRLFVESVKSEIFTTSQVLQCGSRNAVDKALSRFVKMGLIKRLANGVFVSSACDRAFGTREIIEAKAAAFCKVISNTSLNNLKASNVFLCNGCNTSFESILGRLRFKHTSNKKLEMIKKGMDPELEVSLRTPVLTLPSIVQTQTILKVKSVFKHLAYLKNRFVNPGANDLNLAFYA